MNCKYPEISGPYLLYTFQRGAPGPDLGPPAGKRKCQVDALWITSDLFTPASGTESRVKEWSQGPRWSNGFFSLGTVLKASSPGLWVSILVRNAISPVVSMQLDTPDKNVVMTPRDPMGPNTWTWSRRVHIAGMRHCCTASAAWSALAEEKASLNMHLRINTGTKPSVVTSFFKS